MRESLVNSKLRQGSILDPLREQILFHGEMSELDGTCGSIKKDDGMSDVSIGEPYLRFLNE